MDNLSKFSDMLDSLMFERELNIAQLAKEAKNDATTIGRYVHAVYTPTVENLVKLADYFQCSTDYLLGRETENYTNTFYPCPPFSEQLKVLKEHFQCPWWNFYITRRTVTSLNKFYALANEFLIDFGKERPIRIGNTVSGAACRKRQKVAAKVVLIYNSSPTHVSSSRFYEWKNGKRTPSLDCVVMLADGFDCTVDFIIGRTRS